MRIVYNGLIPPKGYKAITIGNVIFTRKGTSISGKDIIHENIHWLQEKEMLIIFFYLWYIIEFLCKLIYYRKWHTAYRAISFEREAYSYQEYGWYLEVRKHYSWFNLIKQ